MASEPAAGPAPGPRPGARREGPTLLVASTGGHLEELRRLRTRLLPGVPGGFEWATFDSEQARSVLDGEPVHFVPYVAPRDHRGLLANLPSAVRVMRGRRHARVVSTGAGIALPFLALARVKRIPAHYIESAARASGPSLTGKVLSRVPGVCGYTQYREWASRRWRHRGSVFDGFAPEAGTARGRISRVVVTLGTMRTYGFRRAANRLSRVLADVAGSDAHVLWQVGSTDATGLPIEARDMVPAHELQAAVAEADLVVSHAGVGSALMALEAGHCPVLLPRRVSHGEHVDDHQTLIAGELSRRGLAITSEAETVTGAQLVEATRWRVASVSDPAPFELTEVSTA